MAKKKTARPAKKATKQKTARRSKTSPAVNNAIQALVTVSPEQLYQPELETGKHSLVPSPLKENQVMAMLERTPAEFIKQRKGKGGKSFNYVTGHYMHAKLDFITGRMYSFEILKQEILGEFVVTLGKLTLIDPKTKQPIITRMQNGTKPIAFLKYKPHTAENYVDIGNDFKASATDAFKKCCADLGIARDVYAANESFEEGFENKPAQPTSPQELENIVIKAIEKSNDISQLMDFDERIKNNDKLTKNFKEAMHRVISNKVDKLQGN